MTAINSTVRLILNKLRFQLYNFQYCQLCLYGNMILESVGLSYNVDLTWPELPKQFSTIAIRLALASLFTVTIHINNKQ